MMNKKIILTAITLLAMVSAANAGIILSTDYTGRTVNGNTAENIIWDDNGSGITAPSSMTATSPLFTTTYAEGHFAVASNVGNGNPWSTTFSINVGTSDIILTDVDLTMRNFDGGGKFQGATRSVKWTITIDGISGDATSAKVNTATLLEIIFPSSITLTSGQNYDITIKAEEGEAGYGNNTGIDAISFNGTVVPEPATIALLALGGLGLLRRKD